MEKDIINVVGREKNFCKSQCLSCVKLEYYLDTNHLQGNFYRGKADQAVLSFVAHPSKEAMLLGADINDSFKVYLNDVTSDPELGAHVQAIFNILTARSATNLGGVIEKVEVEN